MEARHADNADRKAAKALEVIEQYLIPEMGFDDTNEGLRYFADQLPTDTKAARALWAAIGAGYAFFFNHPKVVTFDTSRPFLYTYLGRRAAETDAPAPVDDDPFDIFAANQSGQN